MGIDVGFDLYPALSSEQDLHMWEIFLNAVRARYCNDPAFQETPVMIMFCIGEHPRLVLDGTRFRRFSSKVGGLIETLIADIQKMAISIFGRRRIHPWSEYEDGPSGSGAVYSWPEVYAA
jgi:hypothetical protein